MKKFSVLVLLLVTVVMLSACGGNKKVEVQGITDDKVVVANCASTSGGGETVGIPFNEAIKAYFKMVNDEGGVNGRTIEFKHNDDKSNIATAKACVEEMVEDEEVFAIVGHFGSGQVGATLDDLKEKGIPVVYFASGLSSLYNENATGEHRGIFPVQPILVTEGRLMVARAIEDASDVKKIGVIYTNDDAGTDMITGVRNQMKKLGTGYELVEAQATVGATDYTAPVTTIMDADVDAVIVATIQGTFTPLIKELANQNNAAPVYTSYNNADASLIEQVQSDLIVNDAPMFDVYTNAWVDLSDVAALTLFATEIVEYTKDPEMAGNAYATAGWIAAHFFVEGLKNHPADEEVTWQSFMDAMESKPIDNPFGGEIDFSNGKRLGTDTMSLNKIAKDEEGKWAWTVDRPMKSLAEILGE
jgi:branched-chain amino acid transport system substrate-binding protein